MLNKQKLPDKIIVIQNADKEFHEVADPNNLQICHILIVSASAQIRTAERP